MNDVELTIQFLEAFRDKDMWKEGFMEQEDSRVTRIHICENALKTIKALQEEIERLKKQQRWTSTMKELPKAFEAVLFGETMGISMGWYDDRNNCFPLVDSVLDEWTRKNTVDDAPLYWMPLPKLPKDCEIDE